MSEPIKQPEALWRRAIEKAIRPGASLPLMDWARAAAELRRLHAEVERLRAELSATTERLENRAGTVQALCAETVRLEAERDEARAYREAYFKLLKMVSEVKAMEPGCPVFLATPPQGNSPTRRPLTDEEIWDIAANCLNSVAGQIQFARAIERAHKIGGNDE
jgi:hypothetical protein